MDSLPEINVTSAKATATKAAVSLKSAGSLVAKTAERTKLVTITLPRAYGELGKAVYKDSGPRGDFPDLFQAIDALLAERKKVKEQATARPAATTLADKAKRVAADAADLAKGKAIDLQVLQAFARLGEAVYQRNGEQAGPADLIGGIARVLARRDELDRETAAINNTAKGSWLTPKRIVVGIGVLIGLAALGNLGTNKNTARRRTGAGDTRQSDSQSENGHGSRDTESERLVGCPRNASERYKEGWATEVGVAQLFDRERRQFREMVDKLPAGHAKIIHTEQLVEGTEKRRMDLHERLRKAEEAFKFRPEDDFYRARVDGLKYALRNILKKAY